MLRILSRLSNLPYRRLIAIIGCVAGIDILAWHAAGLLVRLSDMHLSL